MSNCWLISITSYLVMVIFPIVLLSATVLNTDENAEDKISVRLYRTEDTLFSNGDSSEYEESPILYGAEMLEDSPYFDARKPLVLLIHGMSMRAESGQIRGTIDAFEKSGKYVHYNILAMNFPLLVKNNWKNRFFRGVAASSEVVGGFIGEFLVEAIRKGLTDPSRINMIGYSLGPHTAGYASRRIRQDYETSVNYIAGLDPAGAGFEAIFGWTPVSHRDARVVHLFHTNANYLSTGYYRGTADFIFNGGVIQPGCIDDTTYGCSHIRAVRYFVESITNGDAFVARSCPSFRVFNTCLCNLGETKRISFPPDESAIGRYYVMTRAEAPFGMGEAGSICSVRTLVNSPRMLLSL